MKSIDEIRLYKREWSRKKNNATTNSLSKSETWKGRRAEMIALRVLKDSVDNNRGVLNKDFDILWNDKRIDVKCCNLYKRKNKLGKPTNIKNISGWWVFNKNKGYSDLYFCICMIENIPVKYYIIPKDYFNNGITIGQKSNKFDKYILKTL